MRDPGTNLETGAVLEDREYEGYWWRSDDDGRKVAGRLSFSQREIRLNLLGAFEDLQPGPISDQFRDQARLLGLTGDGKAITTERNLTLGQKLGFPGFSAETYAPHLVLVGAHYESDEEVRFDEISIRLSDLDTWAVTSGFACQLHSDEQGVSVTKLDVSYTPPEDVEISLDDTTSLAIAWAWSFSGVKPVTTEAHVHQRVSMRLRFTEPAPIQRCLEYVVVLRNFLSLAVGRPIRVLSVKGFHNPPPDADSDPFTTLPPQRLEVEILYRLVGIPEPPRRDLFPDEMLFTLADARPRLEAILRAWFERQAILQPVFSRYFYLVHSEQMPREIEFESYVRAIETYHRRSSKKTDLPRDDHRARIDAILSSAPADHRDWLQGKLHFSNELTLAQRLHATLERCPLVARRVAGEPDQQEVFVRKVRDTRNYDVHLDPTIADRAASGPLLVTLIYQLRALVEMTLLLETGFECDDVDRILNRVGRYQFIDQLRQETGG